MWYLRQFEVFKTRKTLKEILPTKKNKHTDTSTLADCFISKSFNELFTLVAKSLCKHFIGKEMPDVLAPQVNKNFEIEEIDVDFVTNE